MFGMRITPSKCKMLSQVWIDSKPTHFLTEEQLGEVDRFNWLVISRGRISDIPSSGIQKALITFC